MPEPRVVRLDETEGTTPIRTGIQTSEPGYVAPMHSHPYLDVRVWKD